MKYARAFTILIALTCAGMMSAQESQVQAKPDRQQTRVETKKKAEPSKQGVKTKKKMTCCASDSTKGGACMGATEKCRKMCENEGKNGGGKK